MLVSVNRGDLYCFDMLFINTSLINIKNLDLYCIFVKMSYNFIKWLNLEELQVFQRRMNMSKVIITSDSTVDLSQELIDRYNVQILPMGVTLGDKTYKDGVDINPDFIYENYEKTGELPKTSAVNVDECINFFEKYTSQGYSVVHFVISSQMSSTYQNSLIAAQEVGNVYVVDTQNLSTGGGLLVCEAGEMLKAGKSAKEIADECQKLVSYVDASFVIDNLEFLHKGGRCSALAKFGANMLNLKPCIVVRNGKMSVGRKYRGKFGAVLLKYIVDQIGDVSDLCLDRVFVTHAGCDEDICQACVQAVKEKAPFKEVLVTRAGCTISSHCGRNTLGVLFIRKNPVE